MTPSVLAQPKTIPVHNESIISERKGEKLINIIITIQSLETILVKFGFKYVLVHFWILLVNFRIIKVHFRVILVHF